MCGDLENLELGDTVEYTLSKGKGNKVSAEKVTKVAAGMKSLLLLMSILHWLNILQWNTYCTVLFPLLVNCIGEDISATVMIGKVIRPLRSVDPSQTEYQGLIEITEEGWCQIMSATQN